MKPLVELKSVSQHHGSAAVFEGISLEIHAGEHLAVIGPSGCGKSTLLRLLSGLDAPSAGEVYLSGQIASRPGTIVIPPYQRGVALVFQDLALWPNLTVIENVSLGLSGAGLSRRERRRRSEAALEACGIGNLSHRKPASLSGGQQQRVALARALAVQPRLLLLDEPFSALDLSIKSKLYEEIQRLCREYQLTVVLVSHDLMEATALCSHVAVLENGAIREHGKLTDLLRHPGSETLRVFRKELLRFQDDQAAK